MARAAVELVSVGLGGVPANGPSSSSGPGASSADGRFVVFSSTASNLVPGVSGGVFVRDRMNRTTRLVSLNSNGAVISPDGRYVVFVSRLVPGGTNGPDHIFVRELRTGTTKLVSVATDGTQGNDYSFSPSISANGRYVAFTSNATNLVPGDTNGGWDVFLHDLQTAATFRVSLGAPFTQANEGSYSAVLSHDARFVAFASDADNLVPGDTNGSTDVFVRDRRNQTIRRLSTNEAGTGSGRPAITPDGRYVAFDSTASNLVPNDTNRAQDVFVRDLLANTTNRVSLRTGFYQGGRGSYHASISADGKKVAFYSVARLVPSDRDNQTDVYLRDRRAQATRFLSEPLPGVTTGLQLFYPGTAISADGRVVVFTSYAGNLVPGDTNNVEDVFVATP
jgi:Tol biopolymer transport system component